MTAHLLGGDDDSTEPLPLLAATRELFLGMFMPRDRTGHRRQARHAVTRRRDRDLVVLAAVLILLGAGSAVLVPYGLPPVAAWAWVAAGVTAWILSGARRDPPREAPADTAGQVDVSSPIDVRTA